MFYFAIGIAITIAVVAISVLLTDNPAESAFMSIWIAGFAGASAFLGYKTMELWETVANGAGSRARNLLAAVPVTIMATLFSGATLFGGTAFMGELPWLLPLIYVAAAAINAVFYHLMKAPTALGATIRAEIEGFRMYLGTAEKERMAVLNPPDMTPELFEKYLPYALALDVDHQWSEQFANSASAAGVSDQPAYQPHWYHGNRWERFGAQGFASGLGASLASATAAAATAPGSSARAAAASPAVVAAAAAAAAGKALTLVAIVHRKSAPAQSRHHEQPARDRHVADEELKLIMPERRITLDAPEIVQDDADRHREREEHQRRRLHAIAEQ